MNAKSKYWTRLVAAVAAALFAVFAAAATGCSSRIDSPANPLMTRPSTPGF